VHFQKPYGIRLRCPLKTIYADDYYLDSSLCWELCAETDKSRVGPKFLTGFCWFFAVFNFDGAGRGRKLIGGTE